MSYYDDASIMFIGGAATGTDGKAGTAKPIGGGSPLFVTRGSNLTATRVDSNGLIEKGRENLLKDSNSFDPSGTAWNPTIAYTLTSGQEGYDGSNDAWLLNKPDALNDYFQQRSINGMSGNVITESIYAKAGTEVGFMMYNPNGYAHWNLSSGTLISEGGGNLISSNIESIGNGWYRCSVTVGGNISYDRMMIKVVDSNAANSSGSVYIQDAQIEIGLVATEYIESGATTGKAGLLENEPRFNYPIGSSVSHLLLEPSRSTLFKYSEYFNEGTYSLVNDLAITTNSINSPEGVRNASLFTSANSTNEQYLNVNSLTVVNGNEYTFSVFAKKKDFDFIQLKFTGAGGRFSAAGVWFNISTGAVGTQSSGVSGSIDDYGNGWYRCIATATATGDGGAVARIQLASSDNTDEVTGNGTKGTYFYGGQFEEGSYPTSYIPNHSGGSVSRESESVTTASVPSLINQDEGTFFLDFEFLDGQTAENQNWIALESENGQERVLIYKASASNGLRVYLSANNSLVFQANNLVTISPNTRYKVAFRYSTGSQAVYVNGSLVHSSTHTYTRGSDLSRVLFDESNVQPSCRVHETITFQSGWDNIDLEILTGATPYQSFESMAAALNYTVYE